MNYSVNAQQPPLNSSNNSSTKQILNQPQSQPPETFYSTTPPQDLNQPASSVDAIAASLSKFFKL